MASEPIRDPQTDHLLTPQNSALVVIDYQPSQIQVMRSMSPELLVNNIVSVARTAKAFGLPIVLSTVNVANGQGPTVPELKAVLADNVELDRTQINAWEDVEFRRAVEATGRKKLIMTALWTEVCLTFPSLDAMRDGFEVYPWSMPWRGHPTKHTGPVSSASCARVRNPSAGSPWRANCSGTGPVPALSPTSSTSS